jgi:hypothetical protein
MIIILSPYRSNRLEFICQFIFSEQLGVDYQIVTAKENFEFNPETCVIGYGVSQSHLKTFNLPCRGLLFEQVIHPQEINVETLQSQFEPSLKIKSFFFEPGYDFQFDIFSACFYLLSRYEEYLPHQKDAFGRFPHTASLAFKNDFLNQPLINIWIKEFKTALQLRFKNVHFNPPVFQSIVTYDIDMAWSYRNKGLFRNLFGFLKNPSLERLMVLSGLQKDPFDQFDFLSEINEKWKLNGIYFFLLAKSRSAFDKNIDPNHPEWMKQIQRISKKHKTGIHPSYYSMDQPKQIDSELKNLSEITATEIVRSRQHYLRFSLPDTYRTLADCGIKKEYSMGYGSINGFRASFAGSFFWFDVLKDTTTQLRIFPFSYMDANSIFEEKITVAEAKRKFIQHLNVCKETNGLFISVFHNHLLTQDADGNDWRMLFEDVIPQTQQ